VRFQKLLEKKASAIIVQFVASMIQKQELARTSRVMQTAATKIQALVRGGHVRSDPSNPLVVAAEHAWIASVTLQAAWRGFSVRRRLIARGWAGLLDDLRRRDGVSMAWADMGDVDIDSFLGTSDPARERPDQPVPATSCGTDWQVTMDHSKHLAQDYAATDVNSNRVNGLP